MGSSAVGHSSSSTALVAQLCLALLAAACGDNGSAAYSGNDAGQAPCKSGAHAALRLLTYNIDGLPFSPNEPERNIPLISPLLNDYDVALIQEDWRLHDELAAAAEHPYQSAPSGFSSSRVGDGLRRFSRFAFDRFERTTWDTCHGTVDCKLDCLSDKGFSYGRTQVGDGAFVDIYNVHFDAGRCEEDYETRRAQHEQLAQSIEERSAAHAVIVAGDTNSKASSERDVATIDAFLQRTSLTDLCAPEDCGVDRIFIRNGQSLNLSDFGGSVRVDFEDEEGQSLSDHLAVHANLAWRCL